MLQVAFHLDYIHPIPEGHKFPMEKYQLLPEQLLYEGTLDQSHFFEPSICSDEIILTTHASDYLNRLTSLEITPREQRVSGFVHSEQLILREKLIMEGTRLCAEKALTCGAAMNIAGGTHHAYSNRGEGFCLLNDQAIAANWLIKEKLISKVLILDLDVHQGNGTAELFHRSEDVFTFSMHGKNNYPLKKEASHLDVELPDGTEDQAYLASLKANLEGVLSDFTPDFVFYQSGVDVLKTDKLGRLSLSMDGCKQRDEFVFNVVKDLDIPVVCTMGGGYSREIKYIIEAHANTFRTIQSTLF
ncbi:MAG: histone deacetylase [Crocinitomicaceae bacterium]|nr:histone deacetylase [Crocinitomicaceae bacterium]